MSEAFVLIATVMMLATAVGVFVLPKYLIEVFCVQIVLLGIAHIYATGLAILCTLLIAVLQGRMRFPLRLLSPWAIWAVAIMSSIVVNGTTFRGIWQIAELFFYLAILLLTYAFASQTDVRRKILWSLTGSAVVFAMALIGLYVLEGEWPAALQGRNEASFVLILTGIIVPVTMLFYVSGKTRVLLLLLPLVVVIVTLLAESRASILCSVALVLGVVCFRACGRSFVLTGIAAGTLCFVGYRTDLAQEYLNKLLDFDQNFSNMERLAMLGTCRDLFFLKPWTGWGWGALEVLLPRQSYTQLAYPHAHNTYAHFAAELGVGGLLGLGLLFFWMAIQTLRCVLDRRMPDAVFGIQTIFALGTMGAVCDYFYGGGRGVVVAVVLGAMFAAKHASNAKSTKVEPINQQRFYSEVGQACCTPMSKSVVGNRRLRMIHMRMSRPTSLGTKQS